MGFTARLHSFDASVMRMYRILPPEPLDMTFPW